MTNLPAEYADLLGINPLPRTVAEGLKLIGTTEVVGKGSNPAIIAWTDELNAAGVKIVGYTDDDIAWCGLFAAIVAHRAGKSVVASPLWARNWARFGVKADAACLGDVLVFFRNGGGHVGFYVGEDATAYHVLGGNQGNKVSITRIEKSRCIAVRRPVYNVRPATVMPIRRSAKGAVSRNEA